MPDGNPIFGRDYDVVRWSNGTTDSAGHLNWYDSYPTNDDWASVRVITVNLNPEGEPLYRNYPIRSEEPLDPFMPDDMRGLFHYDIGDLIRNALNDYGIDYGGGGSPIEPEPPDFPPPPPPKKRRGVVRRIFQRIFRFGRR